MKKIAGLLIITIIFSFLSGCSSDEEIILRYDVQEKIESLDPANATKTAEEVVIDKIFEGLCRINEKGEVVAGVAERWEANVDNTEFTFHLRKKATWSDKTPLTAQDFVFGITRALLPSTGSTSLEDLYIIKNAVAIHKGELGAEELGVKALDEHTLVIQLEKSYQDFPKLTTGIRYMPCNEEYFTETQGRYGLEAKSMITNGPFTFRTVYAWESGDYIELARTKYYDGDFSPTATELVITMNSEEIAADPLQALSSGTTDVLKLSEEEAKQLQDEGTSVITLENAVFGLLLNEDAENLKIKEFREMLFKTIERQQLMSRLGEQHEEALGIVPKSITWLGNPYQQSGEISYPAYDEDVLRRLPSLLESQEWDTVPSIKILCQEDSYSHEVANGLIVSWNRQFSTSFNLEVVDADTFADRIANGEYEAALYTIPSRGNNLNSFFRQFKSDAAVPLMNNASLDGSMNELLFDKEAYQSLESQIQDEYVFYPICYANSYYATSPQSKGISILEDERINFNRATKKE
ncbi:peptide ABC transporter substrate-binding protein [Scatolibacter rhodanostii]|uniref:peptide ABC transporter substrate-binding protein n=1 Tax=Scatolibacter rhodanostii TaxID=2014781 RepID=UPI000C07A447|nr:peptide ABC transporter substrate-binding protein [Scatolibacter rhodanostii]